MDAISELVQRLRDSSCRESTHEVVCRCLDAADALEAQAQRIAELEKALKWLVVCARTIGGTAGPDAELMAACDKASDALEGGR